MTSNTTMSTTINQFRLISSFSYTQLEHTERHTNQRHKLRRVRYNRQKISLTNSHQTSIRSITRALSIRRLRSFRKLQRTRLARIITERISRRSILTTFLQVNGRLLNRFLIFLENNTTETKSDGQRNRHITIIRLSRNFQTKTSRIRITTLDINRHRRVRMQTQIRHTRRAMRIRQIDEQVSIRTLKSSRLRRITISSILLNTFSNLLMITLLNTRTRLKLNSHFIRSISTKLIQDQNNNVTLRLIRSDSNLIMNDINTDKFVVRVRHVNSRPCQAKCIISRNSVNNRNGRNLELTNLIQDFNTRNQFPITSNVPTSHTSRATNRIQRTFRVQNLRDLRHNIDSFSCIANSKRTSQSLTRPINLAIIKTRLNRQISTSGAMATPHTTMFHQFRSRNTKSTTNRALVRTSQNRQINRRATRGQGRAMSNINRFIRLFTAKPNNTPLRIFSTTFTRVHSFTCGSVSYFVMHNHSTSPDRRDPFCYSTKQ